MSEVEKLTRELGKAIQQDERFKLYIASKEKNDDNIILQEKIHEFNLARENLKRELSKEPEDSSEEKINELNEKTQVVYQEIMSIDDMADFAVAKKEYDALLKLEVFGLLDLIVEGENPATAVYSPGCGGECGGCSGCN